MPVKPKQETILDYHYHLTTNATRRCSACRFCVRDTVRSGFAGSRARTRCIAFPKAASVAINGVCDYFYAVPARKPMSAGDGE